MSWGCCRKAPRTEGIKTGIYFGGQNPRPRCGQGGSFQRLCQASPWCWGLWQCLACVHITPISASVFSISSSVSYKDTVTGLRAQHIPRMSRSSTASSCKDYISREVTFTGSERQDTDMSSEGPYSAAPADKQAPDHRRRRQGRDAALHRSGGRVTADSFTHGHSGPRGKRGVTKVRTTSWSRKLQRVEIGEGPSEKCHGAVRDSPRWWR